MSSHLSADAVRDFSNRNMSVTAARSLPSPSGDTAFCLQDTFNRLEGRNEFKYHWQDVISSRRTSVRVACFVYLDDLYTSKLSLYIFVVIIIRAVTSHNTKIRLATHCFQVQSTRVSGDRFR